MAGRNSQRGPALVVAALSLLWPQAILAGHNTKGSSGDVAPNKDAGSGSKSPRSRQSPRSRTVSRKRVRANGVVYPIRRANARTTLLSSRARGARATGPSWRTRKQLPSGFVRSLRLGKRARYVELDASVFVRSGERVATHIDQPGVWNGSTKLSLSALDSMRAAAMEAGVLGQDPSTVLYPMSGYDAGVLFRVFPNATTFIGLDSHGFVQSPQSSSIEVPDVSATAFANTGVMDQLGEVGPAIIGSLASAVPDFRLRRVWIVEEGPGRHGVVEFDTGEGTATRRYVHANVRVPSPATKDQDPRAGSQAMQRAKSSWWWQLATQGGPLGVLVKGAQGHMKPGAPLGVALREHLDSHGGLVFEDEHKGWRSFSGGKVGSPGLTTAVAHIRGAALSKPVHDGTRTVLQTRFQFGYGDDVTVTRFDGQAKSSPAHGSPGAHAD